jgi:MFS transporter, BCD family, chlorophyll transporter
MSSPAFGWFSVARLGLVQAGLGAIVVLTTSTLNRVMVVELALPALLPGILVAIHYAVQISRPRMGHGSDVGGRRTPWILGGMATLALGGFGAALSTALMGSNLSAGIALAVFAFILVGAGVSAAGTSLLVLLAKRVPETRRAGAATLVWVMMIFGFAATAGITGQLLDPYSPERLIKVSAGVSCIAFALAALALYGVEGRAITRLTSVNPAGSNQPASPVRFRDALAQAWGDPTARHFTIFVFISMLAYSAQDLILEPFAGAVLGYTPGESTALSGLQHGGVLTGMLLAAFAGTRLKGTKLGTLNAWATGGCLASALALFGLVLIGVSGNGALFRPTVFALGVANGAFSIAAIGSMMRLAGAGRNASEGVRMGLWGASQAIAFGSGGLIGALASDLARLVLPSAGSAYALVFAIEALLFVVSASLARRIERPAAPARPVRPANTLNGPLTQGLTPGD